MKTELVRIARDFSLGPETSGGSASRRNRRKDKDENTQRNGIERGMQSAAVVGAAVAAGVVVVVEKAKLTNGRCIAERPTKPNREYFTKATATRYLESRSTRI